MYNHSLNADFLYYAGSNECMYYIMQVDLQVDPKLNISKGFAFVEFDNADDASRGQQFMDGGQIDGNKIKVTYVLVSSKRDRRVPSGKLF